MSAATRREGGRRAREARALASRQTGLARARTRWCSFLALPRAHGGGLTGLLGDVGCNRLRLGAGASIAPCAAPETRGKMGLDRWLHAETASLDRWPLQDITCLLEDCALSRLARAKQQQLYEFRVVLIICERGKRRGKNGGARSMGVVSRGGCWISSSRRAHFQFRVHGFFHILRSFLLRGELRATLTHGGGLWFVDSGGRVDV